MIVESKFNIGDKVYYWSTKEAKVIHGVVLYIQFTADEEKIKIDYGLRKADEKYSFYIGNAPEHLVFEKREDVFEFCMELTKDI